jgi:DNA polymerase I-like protein with 3'-5' exonuclease and polymerase domains
VFGVSELAAKAMRENFFGKYSGLRTITELAARKCREQGYIKYWTGRRRHFRYPSSEDYKAFSSLIQGGGFEVVKRAMIAVDEAGLNNEECRIDLQVHDSIRADIEKGKEHIYIPEIIRLMEKTPDFGVDFRVQAKEWAKAA